jgi:16S rRNA (guanine527-N7)-methyltransferase
MGDVSRETPSAPPVTPDVARRVFSSARLPLIEAYAASLADAGVVRGLIGPREVPRLWERHLLNCAVLGDAIPEGSAVCDIGSGAGLPGLVLAIARPDLRITLVEPLLRRTTYLSEVVDDLALSHVEVVRGRADALHGRRTFDVVTSRAVAPLGRLLDWSMPLVAPTGALIAMKGQSVTDEIATEASRLAAAGCSPAEVLELGSSVLSPPSVVVRVAWADPSQVGWGVAPGQTPSRSKSRRSRGRKA